MKAEIKGERKEGRNRNRNDILCKEGETTVSGQ